MGIFVIYRGWLCGFTGIAQTAVFDSARFL